LTFQRSNPGIVPDGTIDSGDRVAVTFGYQGISAQALTVAAGGGIVSIFSWLKYD